MSSNPINNSTRKVATWPHEQLWILKRNRRENNSKLLDGALIIQEFSTRVWMFKRKESRNHMWNTLIRWKVLIFLTFCTRRKMSFWPMRNRITTTRECFTWQMIDHKSLTFRKRSTTQSKLTINFQFPKNYRKNAETVKVTRKGSSRICLGREICLKVSLKID